MLVACLGDVMLDVVADLEHPLVTDDDTPARITVGAGGQAANVATWVSALGGRAVVVGPRGTDAAGRLVADLLARHGVEVVGTDTADTGVVVSMLAEHTRSMASDPGDLGWLADVRVGAWLDGVDWLFVSGYALLRAADPEHIVRVAAAARAHGTRVAVDLASASMVSRFGADTFASLCHAMEASVVFANEAELAVIGELAGADLVVKRGAAGACFVVDGVSEERRPVDGAVVDATGAGDALAAGYLLGGPDLAMRTAGRCVARRGAQPGPPS